MMIPWQNKKIRNDFKEMANAEPCEIKITRYSDVNDWICNVEVGDPYKKGVASHTPEFPEWTFLYNYLLEAEKYDVVRRKSEKKLHSRQTRQDRPCF